jgi:hypothetical protein
LAIYRLEGKQFGKLTVIKRSGSDATGKNTIWECKCECGNTTFVPTCHLTSKHTQSCGCLKKETVNDGQFKKIHGQSHTRLYNIWGGMKDRCSNPKNKRYNIYGGKGVYVCEEWKISFKAFYEWAIANGYRDNLTIDRINSDGNYEPSNCRWATYSEQNKNRKFKKVREVS